MATRREILTWGGMPHRFDLIEDEVGFSGILTIMKPRGTQSILVKFPADLTLQGVMDGWDAQGAKWVDLFPPVQLPNQFSVIRCFRASGYRILWYVLHEHDTPQDACMVLEEPVVPPGK